MSTTGLIDLRSDTVTRPSERMRRAMAAAEDPAAAAAPSLEDGPRQDGLRYIQRRSWQNLGDVEP